MTTDTCSWITTKVARINIQVAPANLLCQIRCRFWGRCTSHTHCAIAASLRADLIVHLNSATFLKISRALFEMAIVLWIYWAITALSLLSYIGTWNILAHSHLLCVRELVLKLVLLSCVTTLAGALVCWGHICDSYCVCWFGVRTYTACTRDGSLNALLIYIGSRIQRSWHICWLHNLFVGTATLAGPHRRHSKSTWRGHTIRLHILHLLRLRGIGHATALILSTTHFLKWIVTAVSLAFRLVRSTKRTTRPLWLLLRLWILRYATLLVAFALLILIYVIYLNVIEAVVEVSNV